MGFLEADTLVLLLDWRAAADLAVALTNSDRHMGNFPAAILASLQSAAQVLEGLDEETLDVMRLQALRLGAFHFQPQFLHLGLGHGVIR